MKKLFVLAIMALTLAACQESLEERAAREAQMYTKKNCPAKISETVIMDSMTFEAQTHTIHYYYTLTGIADNDSTLNPDEARANLLAALKNTTALSVYKKEKYRFAYTYHSEKSPETVLYETTFVDGDY
jgi:hypothetical protein